MTYWPCRMARRDADCSKVICDRCMIMWNETGLKYTEQPTEEEKKIRVKQAALEKKEASKGKGKGNRGVVGARSMGSRSSRRSVMTAVTTPSTTPMSDKNSCCHGDPANWQRESDPTYFRKAYRDERVKKGQADTLLDLTCFHCKEGI